MSVRFIAVIVCVFVCPAAATAAVIFTETMGPNATNSTSAAEFDNPSLTFAFTGTANVRQWSGTADTKALYANASNGRYANVATASDPASFSIGGIDTSGYAAGTLDLSFGVRGASGFGNGSSPGSSEFFVKYSANGATPQELLVNYLSFTATNSWRFVTVSNTPLPITTSLTLYFWTISFPGYRVDDVSLAGDLAQSPEPGGLVVLVATAACALLRRTRAVA
jgi:hypothetical protein